MDFRLPDIGEGLLDAVISRWLVNVGDLVEQNQPLVEVETEKVEIELPAPTPGRVVALHADVGQTVEVGAILVTLAHVSEEIDIPNSAVALKKGIPPSSAPEDETPRKPIGDARLVVRPPVRKLARELGVDLAKLGSGSGYDGEITRGDVEAAAGGGTLERADTRVPLSAIQRRIAERLTLSWTTIPHVTEFLEIDAEKLLQHRSDTGRSMTALLARALALAAIDHPLANSSLDLERNEIVIHGACHIGIAVDTDVGLLVPVVRDADRKTLAQIDAEVADLVERGRGRKLLPNEMSGSTITLTNMGRSGIHAGTPIINPPEAAIVGVGAFVRRPVVRGDSVVPGVTCTVDCSFDHRILGGVEASNFLRRYGDILEDPSAHHLA